MRLHVRVIKTIHKLLDDLGIKKPPVDVKLIARSYKVKVLEQDFPKNLSISAILVKEGDKKAIAVNKAHLDTRQRFSVAHELAHLIFHADDSYLTVEKGIEKQLFFRSDDPSDRTEREANQIAAQILMPDHWINKDFKKLHTKIDDDDIVSRLAKKYNVSKSAMMFKLMNLRLVQ